MSLLYRLVLSLLLWFYLEVTRGLRSTKLVFHIIDYIILLNLILTVLTYILLEFG